DAGGPERRRVPVADRRLAAGAVVNIAAAAVHPVRAPREGIGTPLPYIPMHIAQAQLVSWVRAHPRGPPEILPLRCLAEGVVAVEVRLLGGQVVGGHGEVEVIRTFFFRSGPSPASIFPLGLRRQAIQISTTTLFFVQLLDELFRVVPRYAFHWEQFQFFIRE